MAQKEEVKVVCVHCRKEFKESFARNKNWPVYAGLSEKFKGISTVTRCEECFPLAKLEVVDLKKKHEPINQVKVVGMMDKETFMSFMDEWVENYKEQLKEFIEEVLYANKN